MTALASIWSRISRDDMMFIIPIKVKISTGNLVTSTRPFKPQHPHYPPPPKKNTPPSLSCKTYFECFPCLNSCSYSNSQAVVSIFLFLLILEETSQNIIHQLARRKGKGKAAVKDPSLLRKGAVRIMSLSGYCLFVSKRKLLATKRKRSCGKINDHIFYDGLLIFFTVDSFDCIVRVTVYHAYKSRKQHL